MAYLLVQTLTANVFGLSTYFVFMRFTVLGCSQENCFDFFCKSLSRREMKKCHMLTTRHSSLNSSYISPDTSFSINPPLLEYPPEVS